MKANLIAILSIGLWLLFSSFSQADLEILSNTLRSGDYQDVYIVEEQNLAYFVNGRGLEIYDLNNPVSPTLIGEKDTSGFACGVFVSGNYAYVADYWDGLAIIDVTNPENPGDPIYVPGYFDTISAPAEDVFVSGGYAYVANGWDGLVIVDVTDSENPRFVKSIATDGGYALGVFVHEGPNNTLYAYIANDWYDKPAGLAIVNVTDPENPQLTAFVETDGLAEDVFIYGVYAYVAVGKKGLNKGELVTIDVTNPEAPGTPTSISTPGYASGVYVRENIRREIIKYVACGETGLAIVKPDPPINVVYTKGYAEDVFVSGGYAYVANGGGGIAVVKLVDSTLELLIDEPGYAMGVSVRDGYAYIADYDGGLAIVDVTDPANPGGAPRIQTSGTAEGVFVNGDYAYVADGDGGLAIINLSTHNVEQIPTDGYALGVHVNGDYAYVAAREGGLAIVNLSTHSVEQIPTSGSAYGVDVNGDYAYVADFDGGLAIVNLSTHNVEKIPTDGYAFGVDVNGDYAYVADDGGGLAIVNLSTHSVEQIDTNGDASGVYIVGNYAYVANYDRGLAVIDISNPAYPIVDAIDTSGWAYGVFAEPATPNALVYVADQYSLTIIKHRTCVPPLGDVSRNCVVSAYDASLILQYVVGSISLDDEQKGLADVSGNGTISAYDAALVLQYTVGLITDFPAAPASNSKDEQKLLASAISDLERVPLSQEQKRVLEQLKHLSQSLLTRTALFQNYPNPFNPETWIPYQLERDSNVTIRIMDIQGRLVRQLNLGSNPAGAYVSHERAAYWDGRNTLGEKVSSGIYFYTLQVEYSTPTINTGLNEAGKFTATRKMVIMK
ncbi:T9SS type A sorting domain-containing protein [Candidatus Poribacteria bacterium]|nr:T9SS type A sorting domain-containing protein [Candidatus Poribacteria bacterium]